MREGGYELCEQQEVRSETLGKVSFNHFDHILRRNSLRQFACDNRCGNSKACHW